jgi:hypothetical protein
MNDDFNESTKSEWRELGFYCDQNSEDHVWRFIGSKSGLLKVSELLTTYVANPSNSLISEHEHYSPYGWLEIGTWQTRNVTDHWIAGSLSDLLFLADCINRRIKDAQPGAIINLKDEYCPNCDWGIVLEVKNDDFDSATEDKVIWTNPD